jgi:hypothetical protein
MASAERRRLHTHSSCQHDGPRRATRVYIGCPHSQASPVYSCCLDSGSCSSLAEVEPGFGAQPRVSVFEGVIHFTSKSDVLDGGRPVL